MYGKRILWHIKCLLGSRHELDRLVHGLSVPDIGLRKVCTCACVCVFSTGWPVGAGHRAAQGAWVCLCVCAYVRVCITYTHIHSLSVCAHARMHVPGVARRRHGPALCSAPLRLAAHPPPPLPHLFAPALHLAPPHLPTHPLFTHGYLLLLLLLLYAQVIDVLEGLSALPPLPNAAAARGASNGAARMLSRQLSGDSSR